MFQLSRKTVTIEGKEVTVRELSAGEIFQINESADKAEIVALCVCDLEISADEVRKWPMRVVEQLYEACWELMGLDEGNG